MPLKPRQMIRLLERNGFVIVRQSGSHIVMQNHKSKVTVVVPYHAKELNKGLERDILKEAGVKRK